MNDMTSVIVPKSDQWNADDFIAGPLTFKIRDVQIKAGEEQPVNILFEASNKAFRPCKSMSRCLVSAWGADARKYIGRSLTLYRDPTVKWGGLEVGGIRISHLSDIDGPKQMMLTATRGSRKPHKVQPLTDAPKAIATQDFSAALGQLKAVARPGNLSVLQDKWQDIGPEARKALADELAGLKSLCAEELQPDVPFDQPQSQDEASNGYSGV